MRITEQDVNNVMKTKADGGLKLVEAKANLHSANNS